MMLMALIGYGALCLIGIVLSAVYSGLETGIYTINRVRLIVRSGKDERRAVRLQNEIDHPNRLLTTLLLGNNIANYAGTFGMAAILTRLQYSEIQVVVMNAAILVPLLFVFGETLPKDLFRTYTDRWSYWWSGFLLVSRRAFTWIGLGPIVQGFGMVVARVVGGDPALAPTARQRISQLIKEGIGAGVLSESQTALVDRALSIRDRTVAGEMIPWDDVATISSEVDPRSRLEHLQLNHTRLPVVDNSQKVCGVLCLLDALLQPNEPTRKLMTEAMTLSPNTSVQAALGMMRSRRQPLAIVLDTSTNRPLGLVTFKDLVEPITGELSAW